MMTDEQIIEVVTHRKNGGKVHKEYRHYSFSEREMLPKSTPRHFMKDGEPFDFENYNYYPYTPPKTPIQQAIERIGTLNEDASYKLDSHRGDSSEDFFCGALHMLRQVEVILRDIKAKEQK